MCTSTTCDRPDPASHEPPPRRPGYSTAYLTVHKHLRRRRGPAKEKLCVDCGGPAQQWSYSGPRTAGDPAPYSTDLSLYQPRCVRDHLRYDRRQTAAAT